MNSRHAIILASAIFLLTPIGHADEAPTKDEHGHVHKKPEVDEHGHVHGAKEKDADGQVDKKAEERDEHGHVHKKPEVDEHGHVHETKEKDEHGHALKKAEEKDEHGHVHKKPEVDEHGHVHGKAEKDAHGHDHKSHGHAEGHTDEVKLSADAIKRYDIKVAPVGKKVLSATMTAPGRVAFNSEAIAHVGSAVKGRAVEIKVRVGQVVKKGDPLVVVESAELGEAQSDFLQKRTAVLVATSAVEPAKNAVGRARALHEQGQGIALAEVQKREAELKVAEGAVQTAVAAATAAENKLHLFGMNHDAVNTLAKSSEIDPKFVIRTPIDGQITEREVTLGELVSPEKDALLVIADLSTLWVVADLPESRLQDVRIDSQARVRIGGMGNGVIEGKVSFVSASLDENTRTAQLRIEAPNADGKLRPGMFASVEIVSGKGVSEAALGVPEEAVHTVEGATAVFVPVVGEENTFAKRVVTVGPAVGGMRPVISGLKEGESIVVSGAFILKAELGKSEAKHEH